MVLEEEIGPHQSFKALLGGSCAYGQRLMNGVYLEFQKAFYKFAHKRLFSKLKHRGRMGTGVMPGEVAQRQETMA